ncbi:STAS domain-containing protein [Vibrio sp. SCSIO 43136]|uniref:STAS domain-containing protein n=1 Tax=Vibrio sp. SCSIO 43136 TaxID=2819101 RepID=UPI002075859E|nr:STAS domain-containing protein [Vibrio sp. SCSIO 43136]USD64988.1 STAS domain-containing protein [Vibrio sp. SCSIO 43136]
MTSVIEWISDKEMALSGELDRDSVPEIWKALTKIKHNQARLEVSLEQVSRVDSAGLAMLIQLIRHAKKQNCHIMLCFVPEQLRTLCRLSNAEAILFEHIKS